jgi:hypothetical protein
MLSGQVFWPSRQTDVIEGSYWKSCKMSNLIRSFQQHKLGAELTSVTIKAYDNDDEWDARLTLDAIRIALLEHHPRRLSKRGS